MEEYNKYVQERKEMLDYEWKIKSRRMNLVDRREDLVEKIFEKQLDIVFNRKPSKRD
jgi:hypothetical protein